MIPLYDANPTRRTPVVTIALIAVNVLVFLFELHAPVQHLATARGTVYRVDGFTAVTAEWGFVPCEAVHRCRLGPNVLDVAGAPAIHVHAEPVVLTLLTSMFLHGDPMHLLGNMLFLYIAGDNVEDRLGHLGYLVFYLLAGMVGGGAAGRVGPHRRRSRRSARPARSPACWAPTWCCSPRRS